MMFFFVCFCFSNVFSNGWAGYWPKLIIFLIGILNHTTEEEFVTIRMHITHTIIKLCSGVATGGARGAECHPWQRKKCQKSGKRGKKSGKIRKVLSLCPSWQIGLSLLLKLWQTMNLTFPFEYNSERILRLQNIVSRCKTYFTIC